MVKSSRKFNELVQVEVRKALQDELREKFDAGRMTKKDLRESVARRCGVTVIDDDLKAAVSLAVDVYLKEIGDAREAAETTVAVSAEKNPEPPKKKKQKTTEKSEKPTETQPKAEKAPEHVPLATTGRLKDRAGVEAKLLEKGERWEITEKARANATSKHKDKYYKKDGDSKTYRSVVEVARAYYPQFLEQPEAAAPSSRLRRGGK
mmetsp:Transcript_3016/g.9144  ORF Transcript_3016/g.9144 Transcript_3016/m.9144 type:complete len:206 (+) Transcript_3016:97-714(+)|eukprot:CAMPEP_0198657766 /NCGR_PEP_ID=MMETSP1467-20131203/19400_1 /TAXON_ID=1462469 /ORGANISM="unid. sp., Strain CCMP2135" /LENGTH=205 /DNA_ID=CAMNT_0044393989 /DNA_START=39 /DNA_END=656 /DNA_ORIENTATION=+